MSVDNITALPLDSITILPGLHSNKTLDNIAKLHLDNTTARYHSETMSVLLNKTASR